MAWKLKNPPLVEALAEFQFTPGKPWNWAIPGQMHRLISRKYPTAAASEGILTTFQPGPDSLKQTMTPVERVQFWSRNEKAVVQVGEHFLSVSKLAPYTSWAEYLPRILEGLSAYQQVAEPNGFQSIALHYLNRISVPEETGRNVTVKDWFRFYLVGPHVETNTPLVAKAFVAGVQLPFRNDRDLLRVQLSTTPPEREGVVSFLLDLEHVLMQSAVVPYSHAESWLEEAHTRIEGAFKGCLTERLLNFLGEEEAP